MDELKVICEKTEGCVAFSENGILKSGTKPLVRNAEIDTWIWVEGLVELVLMIF